jgi:L-alanine-DL-glutamate epimerase-like enolase superfamily enzyme
MVNVVRHGRRLKVEIESWPITGGFTISRGAKHEAVVVVATIEDGPHRGRGECVPYPRYGESVESVLGAIEALSPEIAAGLDRDRLGEMMESGAARNALDCALWDLEAKAKSVSVAKLAGVGPLKPVETAFTISLASPEEMARKAKEARDHPLLKLKLGGDGDEERLAAVRAAVPHARLIADANEAWSEANLTHMLEVALAVHVELIEQPLPSGADHVLEYYERRVPICADESVHDRESLAKIAKRYDAVNIKLDKTGGLTEAIATMAEARAFGLKIMVGCMVATSLAMAPALILAQGAEWVDLDGPLLLARDRVPGLTYALGEVFPPAPALWG